MARKSTKASPKTSADNGAGEFGGIGWAEFNAKYPHAIRGTMQSEHTGKYAGKRTIEIRCKVGGCKTRRRIATSDAFQVRMCEEHTNAARAERRAARRAEAKAEAA